MGTDLKVVSCKDAGMECSWSVCDVDEAEVIASAQQHAKRIHGKEVSAEQVKGMVKSAGCSCGAGA